MQNSLKLLVAALTVIALIGGCQPSGGKGGIHIMFEDSPNIVDERVYWHSQTIGSISGILNGQTAITKVIVKLDSRYKDLAGHNWAFYVDRGRLMADRHSMTGKKVASGEPVCGFSSKAGLRWFKVKTLLKDRVANAMRRADSLQRRFG